MKPTVTVIGGGLAGLSTSVFLANEGYRIRLFEASPKLGGRTYSFFDKSIGDFIDNGQHILASWYSNTFEYLKLIGSYDKLYFQKHLEVNFRNQKAGIYPFKASKLPPPLHLLKGLMSYKMLNVKDIASAIKLVNIIKSAKISDDELKSINVDTLFENTGQTAGLIENFWKPFIIAVFNAVPEDTSAFLFKQIIKTGFLEKGGSNLVLPDVFLSELLADPAEKYLTDNSSEIIKNKKISTISINDNRITSIISEDKEEIKSDFYVSAVGFFDIKNLFKGYDVLSEKDMLKPSPIVNIHLKFDSDISGIIKNRFEGILSSNIQWVFRVNKDQVCIVISSAKKIADMEKEAIINICKEELYKCYPGLKNIKIKGSRVLKEMRATFLPDKSSINNRPKCRTTLKNLFLAGDWTNTGLPATIESAVKSGRICSNEIINDIVK
jgi:squalene-associated FAD-dependent desaturase